jgi:PAS domain S-box-containing protein
VTEETRASDRKAVQRLAAQLRRYRELFEHAPTAYLVTDATGTIREANRLAGRLLGVSSRSLPGQSMSVFIAAEDRWALREHLWLAGSRQERGEWDLRLQPRRHDAVPARAVVGVVRDRSGRVSELRWLLHERQPPRGDDHQRQEPVPRRAAPGGRLAAPAAAAAVPGAIAGAASAPTAPHDDLAAMLQEVVRAAATLLRADGAGLMLLYEDGGLRWVTATGQDELAFEEAQRDLGEGPCIDALRRDETVWTRDLRADPRWPRLGPAAANGVRAVLAVPVSMGARPIGTCNVLTARPYDWSEADIGAMRAYATVLGRLLGTATDASRKQQLAEQLQQALDRRVVIEQAKGVLMASMGIGADAAFALIRRRARSSGRKVVDVAAELIASRPARGAQD